MKRGCLALADKISGRAFNLNNELLLATIASQLAPALRDLERQQVEINLRQIEQIYIDPFIS